MPTLQAFFVRFLCGFMLLHLSLTAKSGLHDSSVALEFHTKTPIKGCHFSRKSNI
jgi:hypothetical protein